MDTAKSVCFRVVLGFIIVTASDACAATVNYTLDNVILAGAGGRQMTGTFSWTFDIDDFENGVGEFSSLVIPYTVHDHTDLNVTFDIGSSIEITLEGSVHDDGVDITLFLLQPLTPTTSSSMDLVRSKYEIGGNGFHDGVFLRGSIAPEMTWDGADPGQWTDAHWNPGPVAPFEGAVVVVDSGRAIVSADLSASPYASLALARGASAGTVSIDPAGRLVVADDVNLGFGGVLDVNGALVADAINVTGGSLTNAGEALTGTARLTVTSGLVNAARPITISERLTLTGEPVIGIAGGVFSIAGADLLHDPARTLTLQGGVVSVDSDKGAIVMAETDLIVVSDTMLDFGNATSATFGDLVFGPNGVLTIAADNPLSMAFRSISGDGRLGGALAGVTVTDVLSPGDTGRVLTIMDAPSGDVGARYAVMLRALGHTVEADNVAIAHLDGESYPVSSPVPEPATLSLLALGGLAMHRHRRRRR